VIAVTGCGWVTAAGLGRAGSGEPFSRPEGAPLAVRLGDFFEATEGRAGRLDPFSRLGLAALALTVRDACWNTTERREVALVAATTYGCLPTDEEFYHTAIPEEGALASPHLFAYTLPNCFLGEAALRLRFTGPTLVVNEEAPDGLAAVAEAVDLLEAGEAPAALAGGCDLLRPAFLPPESGHRFGAIFLALERDPVQPPLARLVRTAGGVAPEGGETLQSLDDLVSHLIRLPAVGA